jgi:hypothetical protein
MAGRGKTRISPEVGHFLHDFWLLAAFIANTLIFIVVGVIIAHRTRFEMEDFIDLAIVYIGIHLIRGFIILVLFPLMRKIGYGVSVKDSIVLWWGGLRGVIGLAMALIVAETSTIPHDIRDQFLFITAGIVLLTSLINATTIKALVKGLGLTKVPLAKATLVNHTIDKLRYSAELRLELMKKDRFMGGADWSHVEKFLPAPWSPSKDEILDKVENGLIKELRINLLSKEKSSYWKLFSKGLLGRSAYNLLMNINNELLDQGGEFSIANSNNIDLLWGSSKIFNQVQDWKILRKSSNKDLFSQLYTNYDAVRAMIKSQDDLIVLVKNLESDTSNTEEQIIVLKTLMDEVNEKKIQGLTFLRNLKNAFPEVYKTIETRQASRDLLNFQKTELTSMINLGRVDKDDSDKFLLEIEMKMSNLLTYPPTFKLPKSQDLLKLIPWIEKLDDSSVMNLSKIIEIKIFPANYSFDKELKSSDIGILVRGNAKLTDNDQSNDLEIGFIISKRNKKITSSSKVVSNSPLTLIWIVESKYNSFVELVKDFDNQIS